jgi:hypothetical protein
MMLIVLLFILIGVQITDDDPTLTHFMRDNVGLFRKAIEKWFLNPPSV